MALRPISAFSSWIFRYRYFFFFSLILIGYGLNLCIDIMEIDAAQYADISREMSHTGNYLQVYHRGEDYLDKPPLLFWISSIGIGLLGNTSLAYKLLPVFFLVVSLWATYKFTQLWYDHRTGILAALIAGSTQAYALMSNDIRTDGILTAFVMLSTWQLSLYLHNRTRTALVMGGIFIGAAMLAKGPLGLIIPAVAIGGHLLFSGQWKKILDPSWLLLIPIIVVILAPMCYGLYTQFDLHPEKEVYDLKGPSGLRFFFWTQSFGRITGESNWANNTPWYYFLQTMLWDLQPWVLLFVPALWTRLKKLWTIDPDEKKSLEWISMFGFIIPFFALSLSSYKLPHYIFPVFPFGAVMIAAYLVSVAKSLPGWVEFGQLAVIHFLLGLSLLMMFWVFPVKSIWLPALWICLYAAMWWWRAKADDATDRWVLPSLAGVFILQLVLSVHFYPQLLAYQSTSQAGKFIAGHPEARVYWHDRYGYALDYYSGKAIPQAYGATMDTLSAGSWVFVSPAGLGTMPPYHVVKEFPDFKVTKLNGKFLNPATRDGKVKKMYLVELEN